MLTKTPPIWSGVGGGTVLLVSSHTYKSARTLCAFEAGLWKPDEWACAVVCGQAWISPCAVIVANKQTGPLPDAI